MDLERFSFGLIDNYSITSGFTELDKITGGWHKGDLIMIAGPKKMGKTAFAVSMLKNNILNNNNSLIWISTYLSVNQFSKMFLCNYTQKKLKEILIGKFSDTLINEVNELFNQSDFYFEEQQNLSISKILQILELFNSDTLPVCLFIDNLNDLDINKTEQFSNQELTNKELIELKSLARKFNIPIIVIYNCEFPAHNFKSEFSVDSIRLDFDKSYVDTLCYIYRPEFYKIIENEVGESTLGKAFFIVSKNRGLTGSVLFEYNPLTFSFKQSS